MELGECIRKSLSRTPWPWSRGMTNRLSRWRESWELIPPPYVGGGELAPLVEEFRQVVARRAAHTRLRPQGSTETCCVTATHRTAGYGHVRSVVWEGISERPANPLPDSSDHNAVKRAFHCMVRHQSTSMMPENDCVMLSQSSASKESNCTTARLVAFSSLDHSSLRQYQGSGGVGRADCRNSEWTLFLVLIGL